MTVLESLPYAFFIVTVVFSVLVALCFLFKLFSLAASRINQIGNKTAPVAATTPAPSPVEAAEAVPEASFSSGELKLIGVDERTAAMIMAIVCDETDIPLEQLRFKSIKAMD